MYGSNRVDAADADAERTAFRKAEKRYKLYKSPLPVKSRARYKHQYRETDLSDVVDFDSALRSHQNGEDIPPDIYLLHCATGLSHPVFCFHDRPGFYFIPGALNIEEQCCWIKESLTSFPQPPNRTNHTAIYGHLRDLFSAVESEKVLVSVENSIGDEEGVRCGNLQDSRYMFSEKTSYDADRGPCGKKVIPASVLLRKLRWSTLGLQFDWSRRNYDTSLPHNKIPDALCLLSKKMAAPAMPNGEEFYPEAAIVNYFGPSDMLGGHLDDMEADWSKPIVSISLGCKAIFLLGGKCREDMPVAMFLRSGDVVLMTGEARECFHGVPRIFTDEENADISSLLSKLSSKGYHSIEDYMKTSRININIRQVN